MRPLDAFASESHYADHLTPIWHALHPDERGRFYLHPNVTTAALRSGIPACAIRCGYPQRDGTPIIVASYQDARTSGRPYIYVEHGAGQTYNGDPDLPCHPSYSGGPEHTRALLFLCPNETVADRWRHAYPQTPAVAVGSPRLDPWHRQQQRPVRRTVAVSFHAEIRWCAETRNAWPHFDRALPSLADRWPSLLGHGHPRLAGRIRRRWQQLGVEWVETFEEVLDRADLYVVDNSSTGFEFASTGRPVVWLDAPWYRRHIDHGLRFWDKSDGALHCEDPDQLNDTIASAFTDPAGIATRRRQITAEVFATTDGHAADRAAEAIRGRLHGKA